MQCASFFPYSCVMWNWDISLILQGRLPIQYNFLQQIGIDQKYLTFSKVSKTLKDFLPVFLRLTQVQVDKFDY